MVISSSCVFCPRAGPSLQAQEPRLQFCRRQVFHRKLRNHGCNFTKDCMYVYLRFFRAPQHLRSLVPLMNDDDNDGQMIFGDLGGLNFPDICLAGEEKPRKTSPRKLVLTKDRTRARCVTGAHATTWPTVVDTRD